MREKIKSEYLAQVVLLESNLNSEVVSLNMNTLAYLKIIQKKLEMMKMVRKGYRILEITVRLKISTHHLPNKKS